MKATIGIGFWNTKYVLIVSCIEMHFDTNWTVETFFFWFNTWQDADCTFKDLPRNHLSILEIEFLLHKTVWVAK